MVIVARNSSVQKSSNCHSCTPMTRSHQLAMREMFESDLKADYQGLEVMFLHVHQQGKQFNPRGMRCVSLLICLGKSQSSKSNRSLGLGGTWGSNHLSTCDTNTPIDAKKYSHNCIDSFQCSTTIGFGTPRHSFH